MLWASVLYPAPMLLLAIDSAGHRSGSFLSFWQMAQRVQSVNLLTSSM